MSKVIYNQILIDGNSCGYAAHSGKELTVGGQQVQAIFYSLKMIKKAVETFATPGVTEVIVLWDSRAQWRFDIYPEYKGKRDDDPVKRESRKQYKLQVPMIRKALAALGVQQRFAKGEEADDLAAALAHNRNPAHNILMVSGDHDWLQMVGGQVHWYDPREDGRFVDLSNFEAVTGCKNVVQFAQAKAILGDSSDNIKGPAGLGDKAVKAIFDTWGGVPSLYKWAAGHPGPEFQKGDLPDELSRHRLPMSRFVWGDQKDVFVRNMKLMNLLSPRHRGTEIIEKQVCHAPMFDEAAFLDICHQFAFISIIKSLPQWQRTFA